MNWGTADGRCDRRRRKRDEGSVRSDERDFISL